VHLVVVGREKRLAPYARAAQAAGVAQRVSFAGPQADAKPFFGAADAFVLPTLYDPLPNAALEAMACGLPVITSSKSGAAELVTGHDAGFVCDARDTAALAAHMRALLEASTRERLGAHARDAVLPLTPDAMTLALVLLYKSLLEESVARRRAAKARAPVAAQAPGDAASDSEAPESTGSDSAAADAQVVDTRDDSGAADASSAAAPEAPAEGPAAAEPK
jgi:hypothetical protein